MVKLEDGKEIKYVAKYVDKVINRKPYIKKNLLAVLVSNNTVNIFQLDNQSLLKVFRIDEFHNITFESGCVEMDCDTIDDVLAIPVQNSVRFFNIKDWEAENRFHNNEISHHINLISFNKSRLVFIIGYLNG
ncbi:unnamed protein product [Adineta steineri]|uniref:Uncharacterized protein n=1 Tax=Adineta steineri TaxID=433720 RepID=A0A814V4B4_9BILA|nr:unnamed protein product [Adineta steineri]CAF1421743.1 unnamed protein product [Adineta steineri]